MNKDRPPYWLDYCEWVKSPAYAKRVGQLEEQGMTTSDAQGVAGAEWLTEWRVKHAGQAKT